MYKYHTFDVCDLYAQYDHLKDLSRQEDFLVQLVFRYSSTEGLGPLPPLPLPPAAGIFQVLYVDEDLLVQRTGAGDSSLNVLLKET